MGSNIDYVIHEDIVTATSVVLWSIVGELGPDSANLRVYLSDGRWGMAMPHAYEYEENRGKGDDAPAGWYRFSATEVDYVPTGELVSFPEIWTEWYYIAGNVEYNAGSRIER